MEGREDSCCCGHLDQSDLYALIPLNSNDDAMTLFHCLSTSLSD